MTIQTRSDAQISGAAVAVFMVCLGVGGALTLFLNNRAPLIAGVLIGLYFLFALKIADQWEKVAVLRLGRYVGPCAGRACF